MLSLLVTFLAISFLPNVVFGLDNGLALTPAMGWNSWNHFGCNISESLIMQTIDYIVSTGLAEAGYEFVNLDDCWQISRDENGTIVPDPDAFPNGIQPLVEYAHQNGLKFGLYSDAGYYTCAGRPGSLGYETIDADTYASWGVDYLKYDNCNTDGTKPKERYPVMRDALNASGRDIYFSMCEWGNEHPATWAPDVGNSWRTTGDITDHWLRVIEIYEDNNIWASFAGPGAWNDPDMLEVGNGGMTTAEYRSHFSIWALMKAPLLVGCDVTAMTDETVAILTASEVIAVDQDSLGIQGTIVERQFEASIWAGELSGGRYVAILLNLGLLPKTITAKFSTLGIDASECSIRDIWEQEDIGVYTDEISLKVASHDVAMLILTPVSK